MHPDRIFVPTRDAGLSRLSSLIPRLGRQYEADRNTDAGPDAEQGASLLSPWLRHRLVLEQEVAAAADAAHGPGADKFVSEVFWRTYFKGWLEAHPAAWAYFQEDLRADEHRLAAESGLRRVHGDACAGRTGIDCFDAWATELVHTNWLHNHARMWFASIWIFTLRLPWTLGAAFFLRHLLDGDAASNTLSWRWVAGLHTRGKHYVARASNIARYTGGRFDPSGHLQEDPAPLVDPRPMPTSRLSPTAPPPAGDVWLLLHDEDLCPESLPLERCTVRGVAGVCTHPGITGSCAPAVSAFAEAALQDGLDRAARHFGVPAQRLERPEAVADWAKGPVVAPYAPVGPAADRLRRCPVEVHPLRRPWDDAAWPHAGRGFFGLRTHIPEIVRSVGRA